MERFFSLRGFGSEEMEFENSAPRKRSTQWAGTAVRATTEFSKPIFSGTKPRTEKCYSTYFIRFLMENRPH